MRYGEVRVRPEHAALFAETPAVEERPSAPKRINIDPQKVESGLTQLVLAVLELIRQLVERQALRRIEGGSLSDAQVEEMGLTLMRLQEQMLKFKEQFGVDDLNLDLGPLGKLVDE
jgi:Gas vesicle protein K